jgi:hypothetical protein
MQTGVEEIKIEIQEVDTVVVSVHFKNVQTIIMEAEFPVDMTINDFKKHCLENIDSREEGPFALVCPETGDPIQVEDLGGYFEASGKREFDLILRPYTKEELKLLSAEEEYEHAKRALKEAEEEHSLSKRRLKRTKTEVE